MELAVESLTTGSSDFTKKVEDLFSPPFFKKFPLSIERGEGVYVFDEEGNRYLDFTAGWGVTCLGHASPVITQALIEQSGKIIQNPESGKTYSPARARLLELFREILPHGLTRVFFASNGAEANDAAIKLARKASGKKNVISTTKSFHGRTIGTASATGQASHREKYNPLMPGFIFVPYNDIAEVEKVIDNDVAAVIVEPIQGEGGVIVPAEDYLVKLSALCEKHGVYLILDEVQTGFFRTGTIFASSPYPLKAGFMTMAKGIAGGFPFAAFALSEDVVSKLSVGDHGGTYCGNPLGCAVSYAVIRHLLDMGIERHVGMISDIVFSTLYGWQREYPGLIVDVRGKGLLVAMELKDAATAAAVQEYCRNNGLLVNVTQQKIVRLFPPLNITADEMKAGLEILRKALARQTIHFDTTFEQEIFVL